MQEHIRISNGFQVGLLGGLGVLAALVIGGAITQTASILTYIIAALFIALGLDPLIQWLGRSGLKRPLAISVVVSAFLLAIGLLIWAILPSAIQEATRFFEFLPALLSDIGSNPVVAWLDRQFDGVFTTAAENLSNYLANSDNWPGLLGGLLQIGLGVFNGLIGSIVVVILAIYFMISLDGMKRYSARLVAKSKREQFTKLTNQVVNSVGRWVSAQVAIAVIHAVTVFIFLTVLQAEYSLLLSILAFVLALIPLVGPISSAVLVTLVTLLQSPSEALVVGIFYLVYLQIEAYLISPRIMKRAVQVPAPIVVIAALVGGTLMGVLGALVAIPTAASLLLVVREIWMPRQQLR